MWQCSTYIQEGKNSCSGTTIEDDEIGRMNIQKETLVEEVFKNGKKYYRYTSKSEPDKLHAFTIYFQNFYDYSFGNIY